MILSLGARFRGHLAGPGLTPQRVFFDLLGGFQSVASRLRCRLGSIGWPGGLWSGGPRARSAALARARPRAGGACRHKPAPMLARSSAWRPCKPPMLPPWRPTRRPCDFAAKGNEGRQLALARTSHGYAQEAFCSHHPTAGPPLRNVFCWASWLCYDKKTKEAEKCLHVGIHAQVETALGALCSHELIVGPPLHSLLFTCFAAALPPSSLADKQQAWQCSWGPLLP